MTLSTGVMSFEQSIEKYPDAMTLVENNPRLADKSSKDFYYTVEEQSAASLQYFDPNVILAQRGLESGNSGMSKKFKTPRASIAKPSHPNSLPPLGLSSQYQKIDATEPSP